MTPLHPEFRRKLLAAYENTVNADHEPQLTLHHLEKYDTLVSKRYFLHLVHQGEVGKPAKELSAAGTRKRDRNDAIEKDLQRLNYEMQCALSDSMPDFHALHDSWFSRSYARELYKADCAYGHRLMPFAMFLGMFMAIGVIGLLAMMP
jgi:hypothetical protein